MILLLFLLCVIIIRSQTSKFVFEASEAEDDYKSTVDKLFELLQKEYYTKDVSFKKFPPTFAKKKGLYAANIHVNFVGDWIEDELRRHFKIPDSNMFVTNFVLINLLEMYELNYDYVDKSRLLESIESILQFQDKNFEHTTPIYRFWPMKNVNGSWESWPINLEEPMQLFPSMFDFVEWIFDFIGLHIWEEKVKFVAQILEDIANAFHIPPDIDDSYCNLALGSILDKLRDKFPEASKEYNKNNVVYEKLFSKVFMDSWQPFLNEKNDNTKVDPRTYLFCYKFLDDYHSRHPENPDLVLPMTWIMNISECRKQHETVQIPFNVNNLDMNVLTNYLFGSTYFFLYNSQGKKYINEGIKRMYISAAEYISFLIKNGREEERPDIGLTYYPSTFDMYWFASRITFLLNNYEEEFPFEEMKEAKALFDELTKETITNLIKNKAKVDSKTGYSFWDGFLGNYKKKEYGEDRLFTTGLATNSLLDTWTLKSDKGRKWMDDVPDEIKALTKSGVDYLNHYSALSSSYKTNAFFSGSSKGEDTNPFWYPGNFYEFLNGTKLPDWPPEDYDIAAGPDGPLLIPAMDGYVEGKTYETWFDYKFFNKTVPTWNTGFDSIFPFWSAPSLTYTVDMMSLVKYLSLE